MTARETLKVTCDLCGYTREGICAGPGTEKDAFESFKEFRQFREPTPHFWGGAVKHLCPKCHAERQASEDSK